MRLWSIHPKYLDAKGLVALWREALLAQKVLEGKTRGYKNHPQLARFKKRKDPVGALGAYLFFVAEEAARRKYSFDTSKILTLPKKRLPVIPVTSNQLKFETQHLLKKLQVRNPVGFKKISKRKSLTPHPLFYSKPGPVESWEKAS